MKTKTCCFTGHRALSEEARISLRPALLRHIQTLVEGGYRHFLCGGASGFDSFAADLVLEFKAQVTDIELVLVLPYQKQVPHPLESQADRCLVLSDHYFRGCFHVRNRAMVDLSSACICYCRHEKSGTASTLQAAKKAGLLILEL